MFEFEFVDTRVGDGNPRAGVNSSLSYIGKHMSWNERNPL